MEFLVSILYGHNVVCDIPNSMHGITGVRTSLFLSSQRMPTATDGVHAAIHFYNVAIAACNVRYTIDVNDSFLLFVETSSDVFV